MTTTLQATATQLRSLYDMMIRPDDCTVVHTWGNDWIVDRFALIRLPYNGADLGPGHYRLRATADPVPVEPPDHMPDLDAYADSVSRLLDSYTATAEWERLTVTDDCVYRDDGKRHGRERRRVRHRLMNGTTAGTLAMSDEWAERHHWNLASDDMTLWYPSFDDLTRSTVGGRRHSPRVIAIKSRWSDGAASAVTAPPVGAAGWDDVAGFVMPTQPTGI